MILTGSRPKLEIVNEKKKERKRKENNNNNEFNGALYEKIDGVAMGSPLGYC